MIDRAVGFIGAGQMGRALAAGFVRARLVAAEQIWASDPVKASRARFAADVPGAQVTAENHAVAAAADTLFLAVKPQQVGDVLRDLRRTLGSRHLVVSICAGVPLSNIATYLEGSVRLIRVMPNSACLVGHGAAGYSLGPRATPADGELVGQLMAAVGQAFLLDEPLLDAVTGLAGSGPAFVYLVIEALRDGGVLAGLSREVAGALAAQTVRGAAEMVLQTGEHPAVLKDRVTSPAGTTIAGLKALENAAVRAAFMTAVQAATDRSIELGREAVHLPNTAMGRRQKIPSTND